METSQQTKMCIICFNDMIDEKTKISAEKRKNIMKNYHNEMPSTVTLTTTTETNGDDVTLCKYCLLLAIELTYQCDMVKKLKKEMANLIMSFSMSVVYRRSLHYFKEDPTGNKIELEESHLPNKWFQKPSVQNTIARHQEQHEEKITKRANTVERSIIIEHDVAEYVTTVQNDADQILDKEVIPSQDWEGIINSDIEVATSFDNDRSLFNSFQMGSENEMLHQYPNLNLFCTTNDHENEVRMAECSNQHASDSYVQSMNINAELGDFKRRGKNQNVNNNGNMNESRVDLVSEEEDKLLIIPPGKIKKEVLLQQNNSQISCGDLSYHGCERGTGNIMLETIKIEDDSTNSTKKSEKQSIESKARNSRKENIMMSSTCPSNESGEIFSQMKMNSQFDKYKKINTTIKANSQRKRLEDCTCKVCGKQFLTKQGLSNHKRIHVRVGGLKDLKWKLSNFTVL